MKPTEVDSMNRLRVQADDKAARFRDALRQIAEMDPLCQRADDLGRAACIARTALDPASKPQRTNTAGSDE